MLIQSQSIHQLHFVNISIHAKAVLFLPACQIHQAEYVCHFAASKYWRPQSTKEQEDEESQKHDKYSPASKQTEK